jgi:hypothetical protein
MKEPGSPLPGFFVFAFRARRSHHAPMSDTDSSRNHGPQPLDAIMIEHSLGNHDLVAASDEPMTHKAVARARKGRQLTPHMRLRMAAALNKAVTRRGKTLEREWGPTDLFNYTKASKAKAETAAPESDG